MSSSFTDQPSPRDPRPDERLTPTPPLPERSREEDGIETVRPTSKLGSLAQKARGKKLKQARGILLFIGILTVLFNGGLLFFVPSMVETTINSEVAKQGGPARVDPVRVQQVRAELLMLNYGISGTFFAMGVLFVIFGMLVYRFPLTSTITSLVLYLLATAAMAVINPIVLATGSIIRIIIIVALAKSIHSAYVYEKERRTEEEGDLLSGELS